MTPSEYYRAKLAKLFGLAELIL